MSQILGLKFRDYGQVYFFDSGAFVVHEGDSVIVKTDQGMGMGVIVTVRESPPSGLAEEDLKQIYRLATSEDQNAQGENEVLSQEAFAFCRERIEVIGLDMKLVDVEVYFDRSKMIFYFTAPGRVDFRELVKELVRVYRTRIELRQIGVRHETQMIGAVGNCGQVACCRRFMRKFAPVTIKMAKEQNLFLNPTKISGICGRLLCCLSFEERNYEDFYKQCPKIGKRIPTSIGVVKVLRANFFRKSLSLLTDRGEEEEISLEEWEKIISKRPGKVAAEGRDAVEGVSATVILDKGRDQVPAPREGAPSEARRENKAGAAAPDTGKKLKPRRRRKRKPKPKAGAE
ncbi:MAG: regulatory iron-sulfur-containing complex subunit RicT [Thermodesulfobacteriota bacterium]|nr:regulatory iron-sulfur-containing complex subunit RicT [Thermodesulfobacteriota bacterium]